MPHHLESVGQFKAVGETDILTPVVRCVWPSVAEVNKYDKFSAELLFPKSRDLTIWKKQVAGAIAKAKHEVGSLGIRPLLDGDDPDLPESKSYRAGNWAVIPKKNADNQPTLGIYTPGGVQAIDPADVKAKFKSGCWVMAQLSLFCYANDGGGITTGLEHLIWVADGESIGGGRASQAEVSANIDIPFEDLQGEDPLAGME